MTSNPIASLPLTVSGTTLPNPTGGAYTVSSNSITSGSIFNIYQVPHRLSSESPDLLSFISKVLCWVLLPENVALFRGMSESAIQIDNKTLRGPDSLSIGGTEAVSFKELYAESTLLKEEDAPLVITSTQYSASKVLMAKMLLTGGLNGSAS